MSTQQGSGSDVEVIEGLDEVRTFQGGKGRYQLVRALGQGGMGETLLVRLDSGGPELVLKRLRLDTAEDWKVVELFQREATVLESLDHPGIPAYVDHLVDSDGMTVGIIQSFAPGVPMGGFVGARSISAGDIERTLSQVLNILVYLHERTPPVIHRDITPNNIMLSDRQAMLIDFGAVKASLRTSTQVTSVGTFGYMPPEQMMGQATLASDLYSLGMSLAAISTGSVPETFPLDPETGRADVETMLTRSGLPAHVRRTLEAMTQPGLKSRCPSAKEALRLLAARPEPPRSQAGPRQAPEIRHFQQVRQVQPSAPSRMRAGMIFVVAGIILLASLLAMFANAPGEILPPQRPNSTGIEAPTPVPLRPTTSSPSAPKSAAPLVPPAPQPSSPTPESIVTTLTDDNSATLSLRSQPTGATVKDGDKVLCKTPCQARMAFGEHKLRFEHAGKTLHERVMVIKDAQVSVAFAKP